ncbi:phage tail protein I [Campylobacter sp. 7477a]|uniref:phage tail protein I n=1 Tax=Campylobacter sp. 7477a TaxID=2735741 RepID=UPI00301506F4|nr:phage tail protein I [Campylobacter sp. 7477a]
MSLLPSHKSKFDKKLDDLFALKLENLDLSVINTLASSCPERLLPILAQSFDADIDGLSEAAARELIKNAFEIHFYSGTFYSLNKALKSFYPQCKIKEWHKYGGKPYHFKLELESTKQGITQESLKKTDEIVNTYKNVRSVYDGATIKIATKANATAGSYLMQGETIEIMPYLLRELEAKTGFYHAQTFKTHEIINIF